MARSDRISNPSDAKRKVVRQTNYDRVADQLRQDIIDGRLEPGTRLKMLELSTRYGVSPQPVREALQLLQGEGLIILEANVGARVRGLDFDRLRHIYELREAIEATFTRHFAESASLSDIREIEAIQREHDKAIDARDVVAADRANGLFHEMIVSHSGNEEADALRMRYLNLSISLRKRFGYQNYRWEAVRHEHHQMIDAFRRRDGMGAYAIASLHVRATMDEIMGRIREEEQQQASGA